MKVAEPEQKKYSNLSWLVFFAGLIYLFLLLSFSRENVFFSGDAGVKYLTVRQYQATGEFHHIVSSHPEWVRQTWDQGYYPILTPFVYNFNGQHLIAFPPFYQIISSYFLKWFGFNGLLIIPALSLILIWFFFIVGLTKRGISGKVIAACLAILIFCTPLTFYGAIYWEHTLSVLLVFPAVMWYLSEKRTVLNALISGLLAGFALWCREETVVFTVFLCAGVFFAEWKKWTRSGLVFMAAAAITVSGYFIVNKILFGLWMGVHGLQVVEEKTMLQQLLRGLYQIVRTNYFQLIYFPFILLLALPLFLIVKEPALLKKRKKQILLIIVLYSVLVNLVLPSSGDKQWGPRFLLAIVPATAYLAAIYLGNAEFRDRYVHTKIFVAISGAILIYSFVLNSIRGTAHLKDDYANRIYPAQRFLSAEPCENVVIDNQFVAHELTTLYDKKNFFLTDSIRPVDKLFEKLRAAGQKSCILVCFDWQQSAFPDSLKQSSKLKWTNTGSYRICKYDLTTSNQ